MTSSIRTNVYGLGPPKSAGTSLSQWMKDNTTLDIIHHDSIVTQNSSFLKPADNQVWTGNLFWTPNLLTNMDPNSLQIVTVRRTLEAWAWSFWTHFHQPKTGYGRAMALWPILKDQQFEFSDLQAITGKFFKERPYAWHPTSVSEENTLIRTARAFAAESDALEVGLCVLKPQGMLSLLDAYVPHWIKLVRDSLAMPNRCVICLDDNVTQPAALKRWLSQRLPASILSASDDDRPTEGWPHLRKTTTKDTQSAKAEFDDAREIIAQVCEANERVWQQEVLTHVLRT